MGNRNGNLAALAEKLAISPQALSQWQRVPSARVLEVERITGVSRHELRPDLYPVDDLPDAKDVADLTSAQSEGAPA